MKLLIEGKFGIVLAQRLTIRLYMVVALNVFALSFLPAVTQAQTVFVDDTTAAGGPFYSGESWGASWGDLNGDLYPDLFTSNHGTLNSVLRNNGDGTFSETVNFVDSERIWTGMPLSDIHGGTWGDFDNDGDQDLFVTRSSIGARVHLMQNSGLGGFTEVGGLFGVGPFGGGRMPILFDYTNDGFLDIAIARAGATGAQILEWDPAANQYSLQSGATGFDGQCVANSYGLVSDLFNNGKLHYLCVNERRVPEHIFDTSVVPFTEVSSLIDNVGTNSDAVLADFNNDLKTDLFALRGFIRPSGAERISSEKIEAWLSVGGRVNFEKSITFKANGPITVNVHARHVGEAGGLRIGSTGNTPNALPVTLDPLNTQNHGIISTRDQRRVYVGYDEAIEQWTIYLSGGGGGQSEGAYITVAGTDLTEPTVSGLLGADSALEPRMLLNNGSRLENAGARGISSIACSSIAAADFDNDMDVDLYLVCNTSTSNIENRLYLNDSTGNFSLASTHGGEGPIGSGLDGRSGVGESAVAADYNVDGKMDLFVTNGGRLFPHVVKDGFTGGGPNSFYRNVLNNANHWLQFDLQGVTSNRDGFGAKVIVTAGGVSQMREQNGMYHRWSHDSRRLHFGLGANTTADVSVEWPDGTVDTYTAVAADKLYRAVQDDALNEITPALNGASLAVSGNEVLEGNTANLEVSLFPPSSTAVSVDYETVDLDAIGTIDYAPVTGTLTFDPMQTSKPIDVDGLFDVEDESNERFQVRLLNPVAASLSQPIGVVDIIDDDDGGTTGPVLTVTGASSIEGGLIDFTFSLSAPSTDSVSVRFVAESATATVESDFESRSGRVTFLPGDVLAVRRITTLQDADIEPDETLVLKLSEVSNANVLETNVVGTIVDDDLTVPSISIDSVSVAEGEDVVLTISLSEISADIVSVDYATSDDTASVTSDYTGASGVLSFAAGELTKTIVVNSLQDTDVEGNETFNVQLSNPVNSALIESLGIVTIEDNDSTAGGPTVSVSGGQVVEGDRLPFVFSLSAASSSVVTVNFATIAVTASGDVDYQSRTNGRVTFQAGSLTSTRRVSTFEDTLIEDDETFLMQLSNPSNANIDQVSTLGTIIDNDSVTLPTLSVSDGSADEGDRVAFTINLSEASTSIVTVDFSTVAGSAISDVDYESRVNGRIRFQPGVLSLTRRVSTLQDSDLESDETFSIVLSNSSNATIDDGVGEGTIVDDGGAPTGPTISVSDATITEGGRAAFTVSLSATSSEVITVDFSTIAGTATSGVDYQPRSNGRVTFQPGVVSLVRRVTTLQDALGESDENFTFELSNPTNASILDSTGTAIILDND